MVVFGLLLMLQLLLLSIAVRLLLARHVMVIISSSIAVPVSLRKTFGHYGQTYYIRRMRLGRKLHCG